MDDHSGSILTDTLGTFSIQYVLVFYDYPRAFICKNEANNYFLFSESSAGKDFYEWIVSEIDDETIDGLNSNKINISDVFLEPRFKKYKFLSKKGVDFVSTSAISSVEKEKLPPLPSFVGGFLPTDEALVFALSKETQKSFLSFVVDKSKNALQKVSLSVLTALNDSVSKAAKVISPEMSDDNINLSFAAGSLVINYEFSNPKTYQPLPIAHGDDPSKHVVKTIANVLAAKTPEELVVASENKPETAEAVRQILKKSSKAGGQVSIISAMPSEESAQSFAVSSSGIQETSILFENAKFPPKNIVTDEIVIAGKLLGVLTMESKTFQFLEDGKQQGIHGSISDEVFLNNKTFHVEGVRYQAKFKHTFDVSAKRNKNKYLLIALNEIPSTTDK